MLIVSISQDRGQDFRSAIETSPSRATNHAVAASALRISQPPWESPRLRGESHRFSLRRPALPSSAALAARTPPNRRGPTGTSSIRHRLTPARATAAGWGLRQPPARPLAPRAATQATSLGIVPSLFGLSSQSASPIVAGHGRLRPRAARAPPYTEVDAAASLVS